MCLLRGLSAGSGANFVIGPPVSGVDLRLFGVGSAIGDGDAKYCLFRPLKPVGYLLPVGFDGLLILRVCLLCYLLYLAAFGLIGEVRKAANLRHLGVALVQYLYRVRCHNLLLSWPSTVGAVITSRISLNSCSLH